MAVVLHCVHVRLLLGLLRRFHVQPPEGRACYNHAASAASGPCRQLSAHSKVAAPLLPEAPVQVHWLFSRSASRSRMACGFILCCILVAFLDGPELRWSSSHLATSLPLTAHNKRRSQ